MKKGMFQIGTILLVVILITVQVAFAITNDEYKLLRAWTLGTSGLPSAKWGEVSCKYWSFLKNCKHTGVDYGTGGKYIPVYSVSDGEVTAVGGSTGKMCIYDKKTNKTFIYLHLSSTDVKQGKPVKKGNKIGKTGSTGANSVHLHFEVRPGKKTAGALNYNDTANPYDSAKAARK